MTVFLLLVICQFYLIIDSDKGKKVFVFYGLEAGVFFQSYCWIRMGGD